MCVVVQDPRQLEEAKRRVDRECRRVEERRERERRELEKAVAEKGTTKALFARRTESESYTASSQSLHTTGLGRLEREGHCHCMLQSVEVRTSCPLADYCCRPVVVADMRRAWEEAFEGRGLGRREAGDSSSSRF